MLSDDIKNFVKKSDAKTYVNKSEKISTGKCTEIKKEGRKHKILRYFLLKIEGNGTIIHNYTRKKIRRQNNMLNT